MASDRVPRLCDVAARAQDALALGEKTSLEDVARLVRAASLLRETLQPEELQDLAAMIVARQGELNLHWGIFITVLRTVQALREGRDPDERFLFPL